jgi:hypothetical protein
MLTIHSKNSPPNDDDVKLIEEIPLKKLSEKVQFQKILQTGLYQNVRYPLSLL